MTRPARHHAPFRPARQRQAPRRDAKPPLRLQPTTLWDYPSQNYGTGRQGDERYPGVTPSYIICETVHEDVPWRQDVVEEGFTIEPKGRIVRPNARPGLGITINEAEVKKHPFQQEIPQRVFYADGSVGDW